MSAPEKSDDARIYGMEGECNEEALICTAATARYTYMQTELLNPSNLRLQTFGEDGNSLNFR